MNAATIILLAAATTQVMGLIGYDCGGEGLNITSLSLTDIADCHVDNLEPKTEETYIQLLQLNEFDATSAIQCRIEIDRNIYYCGMHSHISAVTNGHHEYIQEINSDVCRRIHDTGTLVIGNGIQIAGIKVNATTSASAVLAGSTKHDGTCHGATYRDPYGNWDNVIAQASIKITLRSFQIQIHQSSREVVLPSGTRCRAASELCTDSDGSQTFWKNVPVDNCQFSLYDALYEGKAYKLVPPPGQESALTIYTVSSDGVAFALTKVLETNLCGYKIIHTEHPKLFILETTRGGAFKTITRVNVNNLDIFSYVNSKFVYVEKHIKTQLIRLYRDVMTQKCALEKQILENALSLASIAPDEMAYRIMKAPGYAAVTAGEVIYIIKCVPVVCRVRTTELCYNELPVTHGNTSYFISPRSRILHKTGTARECNEMLPPMYRVQEIWFKMLPRPMESMPPPTIQPLTVPKWRYVSPSNLATNGIYSKEDLERLKNHIMFPVEKPSMLNNLAQSAMGGSIPAGTVSLYNMLDEKSLEKIAENAGSRLWKGFITFGSASAGVLTILMIFHFGKLVISSVIRGYALHSVYGCSLHILGAIWSSLTHLLIQRGHAHPRRQTTADQPEESENVPMTVVVLPPKNPAQYSDPNHENTPPSAPCETQGDRVKDYGELNKYLDNVKRST